MGLEGFANHEGFEVVNFPVLDRDSYSIIHPCALSSGRIAQLLRPTTQNTPHHHQVASTENMFEPLSLFQRLFAVCRRCVLP